jgi:hypothetical protein
MIVEILNTNKELKVRKGQWYVAKSYWIDPDKVTLIQRISKKNLRNIGKEPMCNQYKSEVKVLNPSL